MTPCSQVCICVWWPLCAGMHGLCVCVSKVCRLIFHSSLNVCLHVTKEHKHPAVKLLHVCVQHPRMDKLEMEPGRELGSQLTFVFFVFFGWGGDRTKLWSLRWYNCSSHMWWLCSGSQQLDNTHLDTRVSRAAWIERQLLRTWPRFLC